MLPSDAEVKIIEKIKFWEEQEKINGIVVARLLSTDKEVTILLAENTAIKQVVTELENKIEVLSQELSEIQSNKKTSEEIQDRNMKRENTKGFRAIHATFIISITALLLSTIGIIL